MYVLLKARLLNRDFVGSDRHQREQIATVFVGGGAVRNVGIGIRQSDLRAHHNRAGRVLNSAEQLSCGLLCNRSVRRDERKTQQEKGGNVESTMGEGNGLHWDLTELGIDIARYLPRKQD